MFIFVRGFYADVISDSKGLHFIFLGRQVEIPWEEIIEVKPVFNLSFLNKRYCAIRTRSLTPFHRLYGLLYSFTFHPCLIITSGLKNYTELKRRIEIKSMKNMTSHEN